MEYQTLNPSTQAPRPHLLNLPSEILDVVFQQVTDIDSLLACRQTCHCMYGIDSRDHARFNTRATLGALAERGIELRRPCLFAEVAMKDNRQPSMYLQPAIRALYHGQFSLPVNYCRALLGLQHFVGHDENPSVPHSPGWRYQIVTDEGGKLWLFLPLEYPYGRENYHLVFLEQMSDADVVTVRAKLWFEGGTM